MYYNLIENFNEHYLIDDKSLISLWQVGEIYIELRKNVDKINVEY